MKRIIVLVFAIAIVGSATVAIPGCGKSEKSVVEQEAEETAQQYVCPMKCEGEKTYPSPGTCPVCGMELKRVK